MPKKALVEALNDLMQKGKVVVCPGANNKVVFRLQSDEDAQRFQHLTVEDRLIYQEIQKSGSNGISSKVCRRGHAKPSV